ncbi:MAG TPA: Gfo/Idh/MocA family oxidoreductase [Methylomirabilota bacterium]|nr:Gfo/Idh/MocA family oxidoreductase [Methylomirabilota bacterium]
MSDKTIRVGFVGAGANTRKHHLPKLKAQPGVELVAVANRSKESGERVAREFGIGRVHADWQDIVNAPDIDAVCIGTWPYMHCAMTTAALERGKHVLCEARMAMDATEGRRMLEASRKAPHLVAQLVPAPHTLEVDATIQTLLGEGFVGEVLAVELQASGGRFVEPDAPLHWRHDVAMSGHNILNMGIWYEAMMRWLGPAQRVTAMTEIAVPRRKDAGGATHEVRVPDHVDILAQLRGGAVGHLRFSSVTGLAPASEVWIFGSEGTLRLEADALRLTGGRRGESALREIPVPPRTRIGWRVEEEFVNAIRGREKITRTTFEDGVRYMEFTDAVTRSATTGQTTEVKDL